MEGSFSSCMITSPSSIVGMKVLPVEQVGARGQRQQTRARPPNTVRVCARDHSSAGA